MSAERDWSSGYVADLPYLPGYYRHQSPLHLHVACLLGGVAGLDPAAAGSLTYIELGCGLGFGATVLAACNPGWRVFGVDFNPAHIAAARSLASEAGIGNVEFLEADLATIADDPAWQNLPEADIVSLHGLWSWVDDAVRAGIVRVLGERLKPGGIAHISYNALPAWQGALGMQRVLQEAGRRESGRADRRILAAWELVRTLTAADAPHLSGVPLVGALSDYARDAQPAYLAHEYLNAAWRPCFHADVARAVAPAKLDWVASAQLLENFTPLMLREEAREIAAGFDDPLMRELIKDMFLTRCLRQDVFVRGARRLANAERDALLADVTLALACDPQQFAWEFEVPAGKATFGREFFGPIVTALAEAPARVGALLALPGLPRRDNPGEVVGMLLGSLQALPVAAPPNDPPARTRRFLEVAARQLVRPDNLDIGVALAASGTGTPVPCTMLDLFVAARLLRGGAGDPAAWAAELGGGRAESERARLAEFIERCLVNQVPVWRRLGVLPRDPVEQPDRNR